MQLEVLHRVDVVPCDGLPIELYSKILVWLLKRKHFYECKKLLLRLNDELINQKALISYCDSNLTDQEKTLSEVIDIIFHCHKLNGDLESAFKTIIQKQDKEVFMFLNKVHL
jgi:hypothetical protein